MRKCKYIEHQSCPEGWFSTSGIDVHPTEKPSEIKSPAGLARRLYWPSARARRAAARGHSSGGRNLMDYIKPGDVVSAMVGAGRSKLALSPRDLLIRGALAGAILGVATSLAFTGAVSTGQPLVGALIFPVGLIIIVLLGLELITGSFALLPLPWLDRDVDSATVVANWGWVFVANLTCRIGS